MAFITATWTVNGSRVSINTDHIVAVVDGDPNCIIQTTVSTPQGSLQYWVQEEYADILKRIEITQVYGPQK